MHGPGTRRILGRISVKNPEELVQIAAIVAHVERIAQVIVKRRGERIVFAQAQARNSTAPRNFDNRRPMTARSA